LFNIGVIFLKIAIQRATTQANMNELNLKTRDARPKMPLVKTAVQVTANLTV